LAKAGGNLAQFLGADAGEGGGDEEEHGIFVAEIRAQTDIHQVVAVFGFKGEVRRFGPNFDRHKYNLLRVCVYEPNNLPFII
jgi:hypothetical protein